MGQVYNRLHRPLELGAAELIDQDRENNRNNNTQRKLPYGNNNRIYKRMGKIRIYENFLEILHTNPFLIAKKALGWYETIECDFQSIQRKIVEDKNKDKARKQHKVKRDALAETFPKGLFLQVQGLAAACHFPNTSPILSDKKQVAGGGDMPPATLSLIRVFNFESGTISPGSRCIPAFPA